MYSHNVIVSTLLPLIIKQISVLIIINQSINSLSFSL